MGSVHQLALRLVGMSLLAGCATTASEPPATWGGLEYRPGKESGSLYVRPGVEFRAFRTVVIDPLVVAIDEDWNPALSTIPAGHGVAPDHLSSGELQHVKDTIAGEFLRIFVGEKTDGGYQVVEQARDDTVRVSTGLTDIRVNTPYSRLSMASRADRMTLVMELRDATTGELVARFVDTQTGAMGVLQSPDSVINSADFRRVVQAWARRLCSDLDRMNAHSS